MSPEKKLTGYELTVKLRKTRRRHPLTSTEQALFYELVAICNEVDWENVFVCSNDELCHVLCISENTLNTARMALINAGLIYYASGKSRRQYSSYSFTQKLSSPKTAIKSTTSDFEVVDRHATTIPNPTTSKSEVDAATATATDTGVDAATDAADYIQTETKRETKPNYASIEALAAEGISSNAQSEERKKPPAQKKKEDGTTAVTPHWNVLRDLWIAFYRERHNGTEPTFGAEAGRSMKSILKRLEAHSLKAPDASAGWPQDRAAEVFTHFLKLAYSDEWLSRHFRISNLASHYDTIIQTNSNEQKQSTKTGRRSNPTNVNSGLKRSVFNKLQGLGGDS